MNVHMIACFYKYKEVLLTHILPFLVYVSQYMLENTYTLCTQKVK